MSHMNWGAFDLNLLIVFDAVMRERNVTRAGRRIGLSQPAMSHALTRLRYLLKDDLFVRTPNGMQPTPRAEQLAVPLRQALSEMRLALEPERFDPSTADRQFGIAINNYAAIALGPAIVNWSSRAAPNVRLDLRPSESLDALELLDRGELDLSIVDLPEPGERFSRATLIEDEFVVMMRRDHPASRHNLDADRFAALDHLEISSRSAVTTFVDDWLAERGMSRRIMHRAPYLTAMSLLGSSDLVVVLGRRIAEAFQRAAHLEIKSLPFAAPVWRAQMVWHRRLDNQPAHRWLREIMFAVCRELRLTGGGTRIALPTEQDGAVNSSALGAAFEPAIAVRARDGTNAALSRA
jgi:DNA-binding transcriptional LysR family regulator